MVIQRNLFSGKYMDCAELFLMTEEIMVFLGMA
jgi:hypothetical protein